MNRKTLPVSALLVFTIVAACSRGGMPMNDGSTRAKAYLLDTAGREVGRIFLTQLAGASNVQFRLEVERGATTGQHGVHFHTVGSCDPAKEFEAAGGHFNPGAKKHGLSNPDGPHAGDLEALTIDFAGNGKFYSETSRITLTPGPNSLMDADGSSIILHRLPDDQRTDPSGNSGARIACGVIVAQ